MMAFALCILCLGTYGFESAVCTEDHDHAAHTLLADDLDMPEYVYMEVIKVTYNELAETVRIELGIYCDSMEDVESGKLTISAPNRILGEPTVISGTIFNNFYEDCTTVTTTASRSTVTIEFTEGRSVQSRIVLEYDVNESYSQFSRQTYLEFAGNVKTDIGTTVRYDPSFSSARVYVCAHKDTDVRTSVKPTCQTVGEQETYCTLCDYVVSTKTILTVEHVYDYTKPISTSLNPYREATCTSIGYGTFECTVCKKVHSVTIPVKDHELGARVLKNGYYWQTCSVCDKEVLAENQCSHDTAEYTLKKIQTQSTCSAAGEAIYQCPTCKQEESRALPLEDHVVSKWSVIKEATCTVAGTRVGTCSTCSKSVSEAVEATGHEYGDWKTTKAATCTEAGVSTRTCVNCNVGFETQPIEAKGHSYGNWVVTKNSTCVDTGIRKCICTSCGDEKTDILSLSEHSYGAFTTTVEPTCTQKGIQTRSCLVCGVDESKEIAAVASNHVYGEAVVLENKTCLTDGVKERTCAHCGVKKTEVDPATGHTLGAPTVDGKLSTRACACGYTEVTKTVKKGVEKTLTCHAGALEITGASATNDFSFELNAMAMEDQANYKQYYTTFSNAYVFKLLSAGADTAFTADMTVSINLDSTFDGYEAKVVVLRNGAFYPVNETETDDGVVTIAGQDLMGAEAIFLEKGEEMTPGFILPLIITVAVIAIAATVIVIILVKKSKKY